MKEGSTYSATAFRRGEGPEDEGIAEIVVTGDFGPWDKELKAEMRKHLKRGEKLGEIGFGLPLYEGMTLVEGRNEF